MIHEREGRVLNIRWAERLIVMPYPDEDGRHLEVINFQNGFGALEVRATRPAGGGGDFCGRQPRSRKPPSAVGGDRYALFVVQPGRYDLRVQHSGRTTWHSDIEVPADRTRLWIVP